MRAIGNNLIIKKIEESNQETKGGLILTRIEIDKEPYHVIRQENVVVVL